MSALQELVIETPYGHHLELNFEGDKCYAIAVIDSEYDEAAVLEGRDMTPELAAEALAFLIEQGGAGTGNGAISWFPEGVAP